MKNKQESTNGKKIQFTCPPEIMVLVERYQKASRAITGPPQKNRDQIVVEFLEANKESIDRWVTAIEKRAAKKQKK